MNSSRTDPLYSVALGIPARTKNRNTFLQQRDFLDRGIGLPRGKVDSCILSIVLCFEHFRIKITR